MNASFVPEDGNEFKSARESARAAATSTEEKGKGEFRTRVRAFLSPLVPINGLDSIDVEIRK